MKETALTELRCPACLGELQSRSFDPGPVEGEISTGVLLCAACRLAYPLEADTPVMLRFETPFHRWFAERHAKALAELDGYALPSGEPREGEASVQETFTDEWDLTREDELSFSYTLEQLVDLNHRVWLSWLERLPPERRPRSLLNVGCGAGMETMALREVSGAERVYAVDLNFALLQRRPEYRELPDVTFVVASLFDLPFERESFDLVYSQGVMHHTYSTADAFDSVAPRARPGGHLFVWVYGLADHLAPEGNRLGKRRHHLAEWIARPAISRAPRPLRNAIFKLLTALSHLRPRGGHARQGQAAHGKRWTRRNTEHSLRDWLSPRYAHRHDYIEISEWFERHGFRVIDIQSSAAYRELFGIPVFGVGMTGERVEPGGPR